MHVIVVAIMGDPHQPPLGQTPLHAEPPPHRTPSGPDPPPHQVDSPLRARPPTVPDPSGLDLHFPPELLFSFANEGKEGTKIVVVMVSKVVKIVETNHGKKFFGLS